MKRTLALAIATFLVYHSATPPAIAQDRNLYLKHVRGYVASQPDMVQIGMKNLSDQFYLRAGLSHCGMLRYPVTFRSVAMQAIGNAGVTQYQKSAAVTLKYAVLDLCPDLIYKLKNVDSI